MNRRTSSIFAINFLGNGLQPPKPVTTQPPPIGVCCSHWHVFIGSSRQSQKSSPVVGATVPRRHTDCVVYLPPDKPTCRHIPSTTHETSAHCFELTRTAAEAVYTLLLCGVFCSVTDQYIALPPASISISVSLFLSISVSLSLSELFS